VRVTDTGTGLGELSPGLMFDTFFTTRPDGMGMGLSICRSIIQRYGGRIWAAPNAPHGAQFVLTLPGVDS
jgi:signal transduction histidine kinase